MRELTIPSVGKASENSIARYVFDNARTRPALVSLRRKSDGRWIDVSAAEFAEQVRAIAGGLIAAGVGVGDRVALMSKTRYEWTLFDFAVLTAGAVVVPIYETSSAEQVQWILSDSGARAIVVETAAHEALVHQIRASTPALVDVWQIESGAVDTLTDGGAEVEDGIVHARLDATKPSDLASIIYTSGTTGRPKGCRLTHGNFICEVFEVSAGLADLFNSEGSTLLFLPVAHVFGRAIEFGAVATGCALGHTSDLENLIADLDAFKPTFVLSVPRVFEKVYNTAKHQAHAGGKSWVFERAEKAAIAYSQSQEARGPGLALKLRRALYDRLVYSRLRRALGGRCRAAISGGAPLGPRLGHFFRGVGVTVYEGYGLTETAGGAAVNIEGKVKIGTVGRPVSGMSFKVADDGEILISGGIVFDGYWNDEESSRQALRTVGGRRWLRTGDIGEIDNDGFVKITGRKKELIVTAAGKNVAPAALEDRVRAHWLVSQCMVVGDKMPFVAALVTIDADALGVWADRSGRPAPASTAEVVDDPQLRAVVQEAIDDANKSVSRAEAIKKFTILADDWTEASGQLTPSLKVKRAVVMNEHADEIARLYADNADTAERR